ncbi:MAG: DUF1223 domain-containing protein [Luteimonas sp.]
MRQTSLGFMFAALSLPAIAAPEACTARSGAQVMPLVELYTSEGCSSCPPADRWLSKQAADDSANWLAFHVDYWDDIGWPDRFASAAYSQRQRARVGATGGSTVYTPQVMVGAQVQVPWRSTGGLRAALQQTRTPALAALALQLQPQRDGWIVALGVIRTPAAGSDGAQVWLAQYSDAQTTEVHAGENRGVTLHHDRVVRRLSGPLPLTATTLSQRVTLESPSPHWGVTAFVQDRDGRIWQSLSLPALACAQ